MWHSVILSHIHLLIIFVNVLTPQPTEQFCLYCYNIFGGHCIYLCGWVRVRECAWHLKREERRGNALQEQVFRPAVLPLSFTLCLSADIYAWAVTESAVNPLKAIARSTHTPPHTHTHTNRHSDTIKVPFEWGSSLVVNIYPVDMYQ